MFRDLQPLFGYMRRYRWSYLWGSLSVIFTNAIWVLFPKIIEHAINDLNQAITHQKILIYSGLLIGIALIKGVFLYIQRWILIGISREIEFDLRNDLFRKLEDQDAAYFHAHRTGDIMARMTNDLNAVRMLLGPAIMYSANTILFSIGALFFLVRISPLLTLVALVPMPLASILVQYFGRRIHERFERIQASFSDISAQAQENFSAARLVRAFAREESQISLFEQANLQYIGRALMLVRLMGMLWPTLEFVLGVGMVISFYEGSRLVLSHTISVGSFVAFQTYMVMLILPIIALGWVVNLFQRGTASVKRIDEILRANPEVDDSQADASIPVDTVLRGEIEFKNLNFQYGDKPVLQNISLRIPAGSTLAVVGPTGSGKSTLVNLIPRIYDASKNASKDTLFIDGRPIRSYTLGTLRRNIGMVPQETFLFSETIAENIQIGITQETDAESLQEEMMRASEAAHIRHEFEEFPNGFDTVVGERGVTLSGGQKQRASIARALMRHPRILILDDALASVDTYTEESILSGLGQYTSQSTTILISHRISTVRHADQIVVLDHGRIVELGSHEELLTRSGYYADLYEKQLLEEELTTAQ